MNSPDNLFDKHRWCAADHRIGGLVGLRQAGPLGIQTSKRSLRVVCPSDRSAGRGQNRRWTAPGRCPPL